MELRGYQQEGVDALRKAIVNTPRRAAVYQLPTGGGKTVVAAAIAQLGHAKNSQTLFLVHRQELVRQALKTLTLALPGVPIGVEAAGWPSMPWAPLQVGMVQTMVNRHKRFHPEIVIVDEAHHIRAATWEKVVDRFPGTAMIGLTATPQRGDGKGLGEHFDAMIQGPTIKQLVAQGDLAPVRTLTVPPAVADSGDMASIADSYLRYAAGRKAIFFGQTIAHSQKVCAELQERGVKAAHVDGGFHRDQRARIMDEFKDGAIEVITNCGLVAEGYDAPACEVVIVGVHCRTIAPWLQMCGRSMRPAQGKEAMVLDPTGVCYSLGLPDDDREWTLAEGEVKGKRRSKIEAVRICDRCSTAHYGRVCPVCAYSPPMVEVDEVDTELIEAERQALRADDARKRRRQQEVRDARDGPDPRRALTKLARERGYKPGWVNIQLSLRRGD